MTRGLSSIGVYLPRRRLARKAIADALAWRSQKSSGRGERAYANWDENALTMAVEAGRNALRSSEAVTGVTFASTTHPFLDRSNAGLVAEALGLPAHIATQDVSGSQRAATSALISLLEGQAASTLLVAADRRATKPGSLQESSYGDGAVAVVVGQEAGLAEYVGAHSENVDFVDHYRAAGYDNDYALEERWVRSQAWGPFVRRAVDALLAKTGLAREAIAKVVMPSSRSVAETVLRSLEMPNATLADAVLDRVGETGVGHALLMLAGALESAQAGDLLLVVGFGQGVDALIFRVGTSTSTSPVQALTAALSSGVTDHAYVRFLSHAGALELDWGMRSERDARTAHTAHYRKHTVLTGFNGGRCSACGTVQFPPAPACVNPKCRAFAPQVPIRLADVAATTKTYTEDWLAFTPAPPLVYGNVAFEGGGNVFIEFTDVDPGEVQVGSPLHFVFRIKDIDRARGFHRYFWKATLRRS